MSKKEELLVETEGTRLSVKFCTVSIELDCSCEYAAQTLFDDIAARLEAGETVSLTKGDQPHNKKS